MYTRKIYKFVINTLQNTLLIGINTLLYFKKKEFYTILNVF